MTAATDASTPHHGEGEKLTNFDADVALGGANVVADFVERVRAGAEVQSGKELAGELA